MKTRHFTNYVLFLGNVTSPKVVVIVKKVFEQMVISSTVVVRLLLTWPYCNFPYTYFIEYFAKNV